MAMNALTKKLQEKGRGPDTILAHITPEEAALLEAHGGAGTINPETGLPEFLPDWLTGLWDKFTGFVRQYAPIIMPAVAIFVPSLIPSIGTWLGATTATGAAVLGSAALSAGVTFAAGGSLKDVLTSAALAGATTYLTPVLGQKIAGAVGVASPVTTQLLGVAATSGGLAALRGSSVKQIIAAAATGAASSYLAGVARDAYAAMNNGMANGTIAAQIGDKGAKDSVFVAADAANLKAAGLNEAQITAALKDSGVNSIAAETAAKWTMQGRSTADIAANIAATNPTGSYSGDATAKSITAGNNVQVMQQVEDALTIGKDAAQLKAQGLSQAQIKDNLMASGVSESAANLASQRASMGYTSENISTDLQTSYKTVPMYDNTTNVVGRNLGQAMTAQQQEAWNAVPYKASIDAGQLTAADANVLKANGYTPADTAKLLSLGYTGSDLTDMASTGVTASSLTGMGDTKFAETNINDMLHSGASINDISYASRLVGSGTISATNAEKLLMKDLTGSQIYNIGAKGDAVATSVANSNLSSGALNGLINGGWDLNKAVQLQNSGVDVNHMIESGDWAGYKGAVNNVGVTVTPVTPGSVTPTPIGTLPTEPVHYTSNLTADIDFAIADAQQLKAQGLNANQITQVMTASGMNAQAATYLGREVAGGTPTSYLKADLKSMGTYSGLYAKAPVVTTPTTTETTAPTTPVAPVAPVDANTQSMLNQGFSSAGIKNLTNLGYTADELATAIKNGASIHTLEYYAANGRTDLIDKFAPPPPAPTPVAETPSPTPAPAPAPAPTIPVQMPDGTVGSYDPTTGNVHDTTGKVVISGSDSTITPGTGTDVAGPYRVEISGVIADDNMSPAVRATHLKGAIPDGTVLANSETPGAYVDQASNAWVVKSGPVQITQPIEPVEIPPESTKVPTIEVGAPVAPAPVEVPEEQPPTDTTTPIVPVIPPTAQPVETTPVNTEITNPVIPPTILPPTAPPVETPTQPVEPIQPTPTPTQPTPAPITPTPPVVAPPTYTPPPGSVPVVGSDNKDYYFDPNTGKVTDTDGKIVYDPTTPTGPTGPATPTTPTQPTPTPTPTPEVPLKPLEPVEIPPQDKVPTIEVPENPTPEPTTPETPTVPPIIPPVVTPTTPTTKTWDPVNVSFATLPLLPNPGLNPGFIQAQPQYQTTSPVQSHYYWGQHPYQSGGATNMVFDPNLYKQVPAPVTPWGLQQMAGPVNIQQYLASLAAGPVKP